jgi:hypothetical protein
VALSRSRGSAYSTRRSIRGISLRLGSQAVPHLEGRCPERLGLLEEDSPSPLSAIAGRQRRDTDLLPDLGCAAHRIPGRRSSGRWRVRASVIAMLVLCCDSYSVSRHALLTGFRFALAIRTQKRPQTPDRRGRVPPPHRGTLPRGSWNSAGPAYPSDWNSCKPLIQLVIEPRSHFSTGLAAFINKPLATMDLRCAVVGEALATHLPRRVCSECRRARRVERPRVGSVWAGSYGRASQGVIQRRRLVGVKCGCLIRSLTRCDLSVPSGAHSKQRIASCQGKKASVESTPSRQ